MTIIINQKNRLFLSKNPVSTCHLNMVFVKIIIMVKYINMAVIIDLNKLISTILEVTIFIYLNEGDNFKGDCKLFKVGEESIYINTKSSFKN